MTLAIVAIAAVVLVVLPLVRSTHASPPLVHEPELPAARARTRKKSS